MHIPVDRDSEGRVITSEEGMILVQITAAEVNVGGSDISRLVDGELSELSA